MEKKQIYFFTVFVQVFCQCHVMKMIGSAIPVKYSNQKNQYSFKKNCCEANNTNVYLRIIGISRNSGVKRTIFTELLTKFLMQD